MGNTNFPPVGRFSPAAGLYVDRTETAVTITGTMELFGPEGNAARAHAIQHSINSIWTATFPDGYAVSCNINVNYRPEGVEKGGVTEIEAVKIAGPSHVSRFDRSMTLNAKETDAFTWTAAHEFGHVIGLQDRYSEGIMSKLVGKFGGTRSTTVDPIYQVNIMAVVGGVVESRNVSDLAAENAPSPYWINDDEHVRDWIMHHPLADIRSLSVANKLKMIETLMGGWISDEDITAIVRLCGSVTSVAEAKAIRNGVDLLGFSSIGQRTRVRVAFSAMPH